MIRRTVLMAALIGAATAAGAWAFAADLSRVRLVLIERARWSGHGYTPVPQPHGVHPNGSLLAAPNDSVVGKYCRFPDSGSTTEANTIPPATAEGDSLGRSLLEGRSRIPPAVPPAICTGAAPDSPPQSPFAKP